MTTYTVRDEATLAALSRHDTFDQAQLALTVEEMAFRLHPAPDDPLTLELVITADEHGPDDPPGETVVWFTALRPAEPTTGTARQRR